jgi:hypothetical protein
VFAAVMKLAMPTPDAAAEKRSVLVMPAMTMPSAGARYLYPRPRVSSLNEPITPVFIFDEFNRR